MEEETDTFNLDLSRQMYCEDCHKKRRPQKDDMYVVVRSGHGDLEVHTVNDTDFSHRGTTPHFVEVLPSPVTVNEEGIVEVNVCCAIDGCGVDLTYNKKTREFDVWIMKVRKVQMPFKEYYALVTVWHGEGALQLT